jgi:hypothetical protein
MADCKKSVFSSSRTVSALGCGTADPSISRVSMIEPERNVLWKVEAL